MPERVLTNLKTGESITILKSAAETDGAMFRMGYTMAPYAAIVEEHSHPNQDMLVKVLRGTLTATINGEDLRIAAGEEATVPRGAPHFQRNEFGEPAHAVEEYRPALRMEGFFEALIGWANDGKTNERGAPNRLRLAVLHRYFNDSIRPKSPWANFVSVTLAPLGRLLGYEREIEERLRISEEAESRTL